MPNTKSAAKAMRQAKRRNANNTRTKEKFKTAVKEVRKSITASAKDEAEKQLAKAMSTLDKAVKKGVIHKNAASRKKSRLAKAIGKIAK